MRASARELTILFFSTSISASIFFETLDSSRSDFYWGQRAKHKTKSANGESPRSLASFSTTYERFFTKRLRRRLKLGDLRVLQLELQLASRQSAANSRPCAYIDVASSGHSLVVEMLLQRRELLERDRQSLLQPCVLCSPRQVTTGQAA